jgi:curli production assembly/transport component CsgE
MIVASPFPSLPALRFHPRKPHLAALTILLIGSMAVAPAAVAQEVPTQDVPAQEVPEENVPTQDVPTPTAPTTELPADSTDADTEAERRLLPPSFSINGLVVDETRTTIGRDFYQVFYDAWVAPENSINYTIVVEEQPVPGRGTRLIVRLNDEVAFDTRLQPRYEQIQEAALAAVSYTRRALASAAPLSRGI